MTNQKTSGLEDKFSKAANKIATALGSPYAFAAACLLIISWASTGWYFKWSEAHSLFINTITMIVTFLVGFLILNTANRAGCAEQVKLDIIIAALEKADNKYIAIEDKSIAELNKAKE